MLILLWMITMIAHEARICYNLHRMKKRIKCVFGIAAAYAGTLFGAGFVSGQETLRFFAAWGGSGIIGALIAGAGFAAMGILIITLARRLKTDDFDRIISPFAGVCRVTVNVLMMFWLFGIVTVMLSAASELFTQLTGADGIIASAALTAALIAVNLSGKGGFSGVLGAVVPVMMLIGFVTAVAAAFDGTAPVLGAAAEPSLTVAPNFLVSAALYISYNILGTIGVLAPLGRESERPFDASLGAILGGVLPGLFAAVICCAMLACRNVAFTADMPMFAIARAIDPALGIIYAAALFAGIFTAAAGISFSLLNRIEGFALKGFFGDRRFIVPVICAAALAGSRLGFASLVGTVYPFYGWIGFIAIALMLVNLFRSKAAKNENRAA